ncbi:MAG: L,D-transpeptidase family protein [Hyphomicrobium sp.]|uniref:L,D-transpeptidase family protein n=1 Tax=Hyphomicrobium sp. TaxID=82 RepID=UPI00132111EE|nr:L,D-transpeptidase family protein [Hyphomicrobium sp.]KAB2941834.1 MAG: L,D-transpeptidase family protein [Hyphomicrobium sp.]MBZ0210601.1 L,D-transpeptidase family protein [Hyphomicrobium sp.]
MTQSTVRRLALSVVATIAAIAALTAMTTDAWARERGSSGEAAARDAGEPIMAIVSIKSQQVTFYDADGWIVRAPVSTGVKGRETPAGVFAVLQKNIDHRSNLYDDAHMPHMQRLTWNGIAMHGGPLPGYAASHGCVRMPYGFADRMFDTTRIGMRVIISPDDAAPVEFSHAALLVPNAEAMAAAPQRAETLARDAAEAVKAVEETKKAAKQAAREAASAKASLRKAERQKSSADADLAAAEKALDKARSSEAKAQEQGLKAAAKAAEAGATLDIGKADTDAKVEVAAKPADAAKAERQKSSADADLAAAEKAIASAQSNVAKAEERKLKAAAKATEVSAKLDAARADATSKADAATKAAEAAKAAVTRKTETAKAADEAKLALVPVSLYISRATQKLYVRRNTGKPWPDGGEVFDATIEVPVTIRDPERPIGTHVFTAMAQGDAGLRWTAVTIDSGDEAKNALDRVSIPQDVLDRIAPTALPRSSIIVSDEPLSRETNYRTEFVAVLSNQPQGGFKTRKPTPPADPWGMFPASGNNWQPGFFNFWDQPSQKRQPSNKPKRGPQGKPFFW